MVSTMGADSVCLYADFLSPALLESRLDLRLTSLVEAEKGVPVAGRSLLLDVSVEPAGVSDGDNESCDGNDFDSDSDDQNGTDVELPPVRIFLAS